MVYRPTLFDYVQILGSEFKEYHVQKHFLQVSW